MPLTEQRKKELFEVLDRTSPRPKNAPAPEYPQEYKDFLKLSEEEILTREADGYSYTLYIYRAKNRDFCHRLAADAVVDGSQV